MKFNVNAEGLSQKWGESLKRGEKCAQSGKGREGKGRGKGKKEGEGRRNVTTRIVLTTRTWTKGFEYVRRYTIVLLSVLYLFLRSLV